MTLQDCIAFATANPVCFMATADGAQPRVRTMMLWYANESGFYLIAPSTKAVIEQLERNPKIELCFFNNPSELMDAKQLRVTGEAHFWTMHDVLREAELERVRF